ncbi:MAG TPA: hypothetical protein G4O09_00280 [Dehalococcoidia bacterium]|nr:hypothetical protein [Dehalococcoidia bacterium]
MGAFVIVIIVFLIPVARELVLEAAFFLGAGIAFLLLGALLMYFTLKGEMRGLLKKFLLLTGASAVGIPVGVVLHNLVYGLFIHLFGEHSWDRIGMSDEPVFFILAVVVCPIAFLVGTIGSIVLLVKR